MIGNVECFLNIIYPVRPVLKQEMAGYVSKENDGYLRAWFRDLSRRVITT